MSRLSIRWRLTLWNTAALAALSIVAGVLVYALLRHAMYRQLDHVLQSQYSELEEDDRMPADYERRLRHWIDEFHEHVGVYSVVYRADGRLFARTEQLAAQCIPTFREITKRTGFSSLELPLIGWQRTLRRSFKIGDERFLVLLMLPLEETNRELEQVAAVLLAVFPLALLLAGGFGYALACRALAPVDELRRAADEITAERLNERLSVPNPSDELGRLAQTINAMIARLERSFGEIRRFTADASHELRTPIAVIRAEAELAVKQTPKPQEVQTHFASILEECEYLTKLVDQLLALSREDNRSERSAIQIVDFSQLVRDTVATMQPLADLRRQALTVEVVPAACVMGDAARLRQVVYNLLDNAIKYTPRRGRIDVTVRIEDTFVVLIVRDTGIGISQEHLPHVFKRFYRVDKARSRDQGGTGLGLSIVDSIVRSHGGRVTLDSQLDAGTTCTVVFPAASKKAQK